MKAFAIDRFGTEGSIHELPRPAIGPDEILVRITAAGVNPADWKKREGGHGDGKFPLILGQDFAGVVVDAGHGVTRYSIDDRIFGCARTHGAYAEYTVVPEVSRPEPIAKIPDSLSDDQAAALPTAGLTALASIEMLGVGAGTKLLINGVSGGVGSFAAQIAHARGATVIGTLHSGKDDVARALGVDVAIAYDRSDVPKEVRSRYPDGVDALLDVVSDREGMKRLGETVREGGKAVSAIGGADVEWFKSRNVDAVNIVMNQTQQSSNAGLTQLAKMVEEGSIRVPIVAERDLEHTAEALAMSKAGKADGKIVVTIGMA